VLAAGLLAGSRGMCQVLTLRHYSGCVAGIGRGVPESEVVNVRSRFPRLGLAVVRGRSMEPTLYDGDRLLVVHGRTPRIGQLVVVRLAGRPLSVKRVTRRLARGWWVERDNAAAGVDSWLVGEIASEDVVAVVVRRVWPLWRNRPSGDSD
jgi:Peptidase S24-like